MGECLPYSNYRWSTLCSVQCSVQCTLQTVLLHCTQYTVHRTAFVLQLQYGTMKDSLLVQSLVPSLDVVEGQYWKKEH